MARVKFDATAAGGQASNPGAAAWACTQLGFRVFPLVPGAGTPALKLWPEVATRDAWQVHDWWAGEYRGYGVGIACGPESGIWVLDIDAKHGVDGYDTWANLVIANGRIPNTMMVKTPSGGAHVYFTWAEGIANSTGTHNRLGPGLDVRADHGYVRAPGWAGYDVIAQEGVRRCDVAAAPGWLSALAQKPRREAAGERLRRAAPGSSWAKFATTRTLETLGRAPAGGRNDALNRAAFRLGVSGTVSEDEAWDACWNIMARIGGGDQTRERRTFESGWNAGLAAREEA